MGGQTILGMLELSALVEQFDRAGVDVGFWPFDGRSIDDPAYAGKHVGVEIYPTLLRPRGIEQTDSNDALYSALYCRELDGNGEIHLAMTIPDADLEARSCLREGWILGCPYAALKSQQGARTPQVATAAINGSPEATTEQQEIIDCKDRLVRVIARAGTGKTWTMVRRAKRSLDADPSARVTMLTFTRNGADEMRARFRALAGDNARFEAATFHGLATSRLLAHHPHLDLGDGIHFKLDRIRLLNEFDRAAVLDYFRLSQPEQVLGDGWMDELSAAINKTDPKGRSPLELLVSAPGTKSLPRPADAWRGILRLYAQESLLDFDVIIVLYEYLLRTDKTFRMKAHGNLTHLIVDEFQDTNYPQLRCIESLAGYGSTSPSPIPQLMVVGDDFQTIYEWRGAVPDVFGELNGIGAGEGIRCTTKGLRTSWRSGADVLHLVNLAGARLALHPKHSGLSQLVPAAIQAGRADLKGGYFGVPPVSSEYKTAIDLLRGEGLDPQEITVLSYKNKTARDVHSQLLAAGIACDLITARPEDIDGVRRFLLLVALWLQHGAADFPLFWGIAREFAELSTEVFDDLFSTVRNQAPHDTIQTIVGLVGTLGPSVERMFRMEEPDRVDAPMLERVVELLRLDSRINVDRTACMRIARVLGEMEGLKEDPLRTIGEMTRKDFAGAPANGDRSVSISTIHQYKGLENKGVIVVYDFNPLDGSGNASDARLDYVARSRAMLWLAGINLPASVANEWASPPS